MKPNIILIVAGLLGSIFDVSAADRNVRFVGRPVVRRVLQRTPEYLGGDVELSAKVQVTNADGTAIPDSAVIVYARSKDGVASKLRAYGVTGRNGMATPRVVFDLPVLSRRATVQACLVEPPDECSAVAEVDLHQKTDLELHYVHQEAATFGTAYYALNGKAKSSGVAQSSTIDQFRPRFVFNAWERVKNLRSSSLTLFGEAVVAVSRQDGFVPRTNASVGFGRLAVGATAEVVSRLQIEASWGPRIGDTPGFTAATVTYGQPVGDRNRLLIGMVSSRPLSALFDMPHNGSLYGPRAGFTRLSKSGAYRITAWAEYQFNGEAIYEDKSGDLIRQPRTQAPALGLDWNYHRGGPVFVTFSLFAGGVGTSLPYVGASAEITLRDFVRGFP